MTKKNSTNNFNSSSKSRSVHTLKDKEYGENEEDEDEDLNNFENGNEKVCFIIFQSIKTY